MIAGLQISRPDKLLFPADGITKADLARYYAGVADTMLPHVAGRPVHMQRFPDGIDGEELQQKRVPGHFPDWVGRATVPRKRGGEITHVVIADARTLVYLADQACITPHVWLSRADRPDCPDRLIFDLDPASEDLPALKRAARAVRDLIEQLGLSAFVLATGSRGLHVTTPLDASAGFDEVRAFARDAARLLAARLPDCLTVEQRKDRRQGRIYLDVARNGYAQTAVAPYAVRARPGAPVATPLEWDELSRSGFRPDGHTLRTISRRLSRRGDPWREINREAGSLGGARDALDQLLAQ